MNISSVKAKKNKVRRSAKRSNYSAHTFQKYILINHIPKKNLSHKETFYLTIVCLLAVALLIAISYS